MDDLVAFLRARLDDDERVANACADAGSVGRAAQYAYDMQGEAVAEHIERHEPERVLAEVAAKRRIVDLCEIMEADPNFLDAGTILPGDEKELAMRVLMLLALPCAGHPEYRPEWTVATEGAGTI